MDKGILDIELGKIDAKVTCKVAKLIAEYIGGVIFVWLVTFTQSISINFIGVSETLAGIAFFIHTFLGIPLSGALGILLVESAFNKLIFKKAAICDIRKLIAGFLMGLLGIGCVYLIMFYLPRDYEDQLFGWFEWNLTGWEPFILLSVFFALIGYNLAGLFGCKRNLSSDLKT